MAGNRKKTQSSILFLDNTKSMKNEDFRTNSISGKRMKTRSSIFVDNTKSMKEEYFKTIGTEYSEFMKKTKTTQEKIGRWVK